MGRGVVAVGMGGGVCVLVGEVIVALAVAVAEKLAACVAKADSTVAKTSGVGSVCEQAVTKDTDTTATMEFNIQSFI